MGGSTGSGCIKYGDTICIGTFHFAALTRKYCNIVCICGFHDLMCANYSVDCCNKAMWACIFAFKIFKVASMLNRYVVFVGMSSSYHVKLNPLLYDLFVFSV